MQQTFTLSSGSLPGAGSMLLHSLPVPLDSISDREQELVLLASMLSSHQVRLLTLTGPGGVGKTRLALAVAHDLQSSFASAIYFVPLATVSSPDFVVPAIAQALGLGQNSSRSLFKELQVALGYQSILLLLDSFEHVLAAVPQLADLLAACPYLHLLVTSRTPLRLPGEYEYAVLPLALPAPGQLSEQPEPLSITSLLERGISYFRHEHYTEGMALFSLAREHLMPDYNMDLAAILDTLMQEYEKYSHLQQTLQEASFRLGELNVQLQVNITGARPLPSKLIANLDNEHASTSEHEELKEPSTEHAVACPSLYATCLAPFRLSCLDVPLPLCSNRNGQALLRYLVAQQDHSATADTLMSLFWPEDPPEVALRKLHVTVSILRRSLQSGYDLPGGYVLYKQQIYQLNPAIPLHSDVEEFLDLYNQGCKAQEDGMASCYESACVLYTRPFLMEDLYADWSFTRREQLRQIHLSMCSALAAYYLQTHSYEKASRWAVSIIEENPCDEAAYRQLMRIYAMQGRRNDALRQYQRCQQVLSNELGMQPMPETVALYHAIVRGEL